jgi:LacI family transcriptional regulator
MADIKSNGKAASAGRAKVNIHNIAREAEVSIATVSRVINRHASVSPEVRQRVQATITRLAYRPNIIARSLRTQQSGSFGVVIPNISNAHFSDAVRAIQDEAEQSGYTTLVVNTDGQGGREQAAIRTLLERRVEGIVLVSSSSAVTPALFDAIRTGTPVVAMDRRIDHINVDHVVIDTRQGTRDAVRHLAEQNRRRIAFIAGPSHLWTSKEKRAGYREGLKRSGLKYDPALVFPGDYSFASGEQQAASLLMHWPRPDGVVAANNLMALGAMRTLLRAELKIPRDLAFFGVDDTDWTDTIKPSVSVVSQPTATMGRETVRLLLRRIESGPAVGRGETVVLPSSLVLRESTEGKV